MKIVELDKVRASIQVRQKYNNYAIQEKLINQLFNSIVRRMVSNASIIKSMIFSVESIGGFVKAAGGQLALYV